MKNFLKKLVYELLVWGKPLLKAKLKKELKPIIEAELQKINIKKESIDNIYNELIEKIKAAI